MSEAFEHALMAHQVQPMNYIEFRNLWVPHWHTICANGHVVFPANSNQVVPNHVVACLVTYNVALGREILGISGHNQFLSVTNDAMVKFNKRATNQDVLASKVLSALNQCINDGRYQ